METKANTGQERPGDPCAIVIFGAAGDLTRRKLLPALYNLRVHGLLPKDFSIVGVARKELSDEVFREGLTADMQQFATTKVDPQVWAEFRDRLYYVSGEFTNRETYEKLKKRLEDSTTKHKTGGNVLFYLSTPPEFFAEIVDQLGAVGLVNEESGGWRRVIVEKPFGVDLDSAKVLNKRLQKTLQEHQIYRIDHYLGKETVQNIMVFRFANGLFEPIWNREYVDNVQITVAESIGVEGRGNYYDGSGVLRDMIQNHMFQLLAVVAMEPPISFAAEAVRNERVKVLHAIKPMSPEQILENTVRGQYGEGFVKDQKVPAYRSEPRVNPNSNTETYAAMKLNVENWRWSGVPFYLRSGKRLARRNTTIVIEFRRPPLLLFQKNKIEDIEPNRLVMHIQPKEGIHIEIKAKVPGPAIHLKTVNLDFNYESLGGAGHATGYERLLYDCMIGDSTLFHRADMVEAAWSIATPMLDLWKSLPARDFPNYASATWGPASGDELLARDGRHWLNL